MGNYAVAADVGLEFPAVDFGAAAAKVKTTTVDEWIVQAEAFVDGKVGLKFQVPVTAAEAKIEEFVAGRGVVVKWERLRRQNHWFDALYNACAAGHLCGVRLVGERPEQVTRRRVQKLMPTVTMPDGRPFLITER